jgi:aspartate-semialdehyde dehydrogenase
MKVGVVGATGVVGREIIRELDLIQGQNLSVKLFASVRSAGQTLHFGQESFEVKEFSFEEAKLCDYILMSAGSEFSKQWTEPLADAGVVVIDNSSAWRMDPRFPLLVPEVNSKEITEFSGNRIFPNPNCSTIQLAVTLKPLLDAFGVESINVCSYQSVSGSGQSGVDELLDQSRAHLDGQPYESREFPRKIAFDLIPAIDRIVSGGHSYEEVKIIEETRKILKAPKLAIMATTIRVPTLRGHGEAVSINLDESVTVEQVLEAFENFSSIVVHGNSYAEMPNLETVVGKPTVHVSRVRLPLGTECSNQLQFWNVADNICKGAATNSVQILKHLIHRP